LLLSKGGKKRFVVKEKYIEIYNSKEEHKRRGEGEL
jgi:hypothetical protein